MGVRTSSCAALGVVVLAGLAGCGTPALPTRPQLHSAPAQWAEAGTTAAGAVSADPWWHTLGDPTLAALVEQALQANRDIARSALRIQQAALRAQQEQRGRLPQFSAGGSAGAQRPLQSQGRESVVVDGVTIPVGGGGGTSTSSGLSVSASWEIDLWGRLADGVAVAQNQQRISEADRQAARWLLSTQVAEAHWTLAMLAAKAPLLRETTADAMASLAAARLRATEGKTRVSDADRADAALRDARQRETALAQQQRAAQQTLALLLDQLPQGFNAPPARMPSAAPPDFAAGPPAEVLDRRPDLRSARLAVDNALLKLRIAEHARYPQLRLSAGIGTGGSGLDQWLRNPLASVGAGLALPIVDGARLGTERDIAQLQLDEAAMAFRDVLLKAVGDVETRMREGRQLEDELALTRQRVADADRALVQARLRHSAGAEPLQAVRDARQTQRDAQAALLDLQLKRWVNVVATLRALGGAV